MHPLSHSDFEETNDHVRFPTFFTSSLMIPVVIILLLLTALVATEPSSTNGNGDS